MKWDVDDRLALSAESMREMGYRVVDIVAENLKELRLSLPTSFHFPRNPLLMYGRRDPSDKTSSQM